ncbi:MAG: LacI family transcriptional regulator [Treponema sp.]|nr:LacI family transcriptional regulator [Treponema sp.]
MATISDIAKKANVSRSLVSRVLNNKSGVSPANRKTILEAISEYNYKPNALARALANQKTQTIGVVMDDLCDKFIFDLIRGMQDTGEKLGYNIIFCSGNANMDVKIRYVDYFMQGRTDGMIAFGSRLTDSNIFREMVEQPNPFVLIEGNIPDHEFNNIQLDNAGGAYKATKHLLDLGYKKIWHVTGDLNFNVSLDRRKGFLMAMQDYNADINEDSIIIADFEEELAHKRVSALLRDKKVPDACFAGADKTAYGVIRALYENGLRVPQDVAIIGFDDDKPDTFDMLFPKLTTLRQPLYEMGKAGVEILIHSIENPKVKPKIVVFEPELIIGETCP